MRSFVNQFVAILLCCWLQQSTAAQHTLVVAVDESLYPYTYTGPKGDAAGADVDLLKAAAKRIGIELRFVPIPWKRVQQMLKAGDVQLAMPLFFTPERDRYAQYIVPVHYSATALFMVKDRSFTFKDIRDLYGKTIGYNRGYALPDELAQAVRQNKVVAEEVNATQQNVQKLLLGRLDAFVGNYVNTISALCGIPGSENVVASPRLLSTNRPAYVVFSRAASIPERTDLEQKLRDAIETMNRNREAYQILPGCIKSQ